MNINSWWAVAAPIVMGLGLKIVGGLVLYIAGRWLIGVGVSLMTRLLTARNFDPTLQRYLANVLGVALNIVLVVAILGYFGVETTSFAALLAGVGLAVGRPGRGCWPISPPAPS